jgi:hypothetical protein
MNPYVKRIRPAEDYLLELLFQNGERRIFDLKPYLGRGVFAQLRNRAVFRAARVVAGSVEWPGEVDLSYDTLYLESYPLTAPARREVAHR